jgi:hypothetical protein
MKNQVKKFNQFIKESISMRDEFESNIPDFGNRKVAIVELGRGMDGSFASITFDGSTAHVEEKRSLRKTWQNILNIAHGMGAEAIYSTEDDDIITQRDIDTLDDSPSGWSDRD